MAAKKIKVELNKPRIDFSKSAEKIKSTAKTVNTEVTDTAYEVLEDLKNNGANLKDVFSVKFKEALDKATVSNGVKFAKETTEKVNDYSVETAEEIIEEVLKGSKIWQNFLEKALKNGVGFYADQQELVFDTLEKLKGQYKTGNLKFKDLFNFSFDIETEATELVKETKKATRKVVKKASKIVNEVVEEIEETVEEVTEVAQELVNEIEETVEKITTDTKVPTKKVATTKVKSKAKRTTNKPKAAAKKTTKKTTTKKTALVKNNLRVIEGIGPKIEGLLNEAGIQTFNQLAKAKQADLKEILASAGPRYKMHNPATWTKQAALAAKGKREALAKLQAELKGGKK